MTTEEIMQVALDLAGFARIPEDSAIYVRGDRIRRVLFGIDVGPAELLLARQLGFDCVVAHHPVNATPDAWKVYLRHVEFMVAAGVPEDAALAAVADRVDAYRVRAHVWNYDHVPSVARLLGIPFLNVHAPLDEVGRRRMIEVVRHVQSEDPHATVGDLARALGRLPEITNAQTAVEVRLGSADSVAGNVVVAHGALTNGGYDVASTCFAHGVDTVVYIHIDYAELQRLRRDGRGNLIVTGHIASDSLGFTPFLQALRARGLEVTTFSGVIAP
ncbi:MAG: hypothetical protein QN163_07330 [Armatimonadota bacterium]|nr:hypothetical protein [Armatimonadota bacterium]MDR5696982.1 hypothetical protein [Armatimonadota bacterium]